MRWVALSLAGPGIWATGFALAYALHGAGCAAGWTGVVFGPGLDLHRAALWGTWLATLLAGGLLLLVLRGRDGTERTGQVTLPSRLPRDGAWIGLAATLVTLLPVAIASTC